MPALCGPRAGVTRPSSQSPRTGASRVSSRPGRSPPTSYKPAAFTPGKGASSASRPCAPGGPWTTRPWGRLRLRCGTRAGGRSGGARLSVSRDGPAPLPSRPGPGTGQEIADGLHHLGPFKLVVVVAGQPTARLNFRQPRPDVGGQAGVVVARVQVHPIDRGVAEQPRGG